MVDYFVCLWGMESFFNGLVRDKINMEVMKIFRDGINILKI